MNLFTLKRGKQQLFKTLRAKYVPQPMTIKPDTELN